jgi:hypothetical protein
MAQLYVRAPTSTTKAHKMSDMMMAMTRSRVVREEVGMD